jgi:hypothetical protein
VDPSVQLLDGYTLATPEGPGRKGNSAQEEPMTPKGTFIFFVLSPLSSLCVWAVDLASPAPSPPSNLTEDYRPHAQAPQRGFRAWASPEDAPSGSGSRRG